MIWDDQGQLWLSDGWVVMAALVLAVALILWCHSRLRAELEVQPAGPMRPRARRTPRHSAVRMGRRTGYPHSGVRAA
jgi:hypothetical protein